MESSPGDDQAFHDADTYTVPSCCKVGNRVRVIGDKISSRALVSWVNEEAGTIDCILHDTGVEVRDTEPHNRQ